MRGLKVVRLGFATDEGAVCVRMRQMKALNKRDDCGWIAIVGEDFRPKKRF